jgi:hypothetical protein
MSEENKQVDKDIAEWVSGKNDTDTKEKKEEEKKKNESDKKEKNQKTIRHNKKKVYKPCVRKPCTSVSATREHIRGLTGCCKTCCRRRTWCSKPIGTQLLPCKMCGKVFTSDAALVTHKEICGVWIVYNCVHYNY